MLVQPALVLRRLRQPLAKGATIAAARTRPVEKGNIGHSLCCQSVDEFIVVMLDQIILVLDAHDCRYRLGFGVLRG